MKDHENALGCHGNYEEWLIEDYQNRLNMLAQMMQRKETPRLA